MELYHLACGLYGMIPWLGTDELEKVETDMRNDRTRWEKEYLYNTMVTAVHSVQEHETDASLSSFWIGAFPVHSLEMLATNSVLV